MIKTVGKCARPELRRGCLKKGKDTHVLLKMRAKTLNRTFEMELTRLFLWAALTKHLQIINLEDAAGFRALDI